MPDCWAPVYSCAQPGALYDGDSCSFRSHPAEKSCCKTAGAAEQIRHHRCGGSHRPWACEKRRRPVGEKRKGETKRESTLPEPHSERQSALRKTARQVRGRSQAARERRGKKGAFEKEPRGGALFRRGGKPRAPYKKRCFIDWLRTLPLATGEMEKLHPGTVFQRNKGRGLSYKTTEAETGPSRAWPRRPTRL
ncbi:hypothetical protein MRX96_036456 [Rhipicephalus microplus]